MRRFLVFLLFALLLLPQLARAGSIALIVGEQGAAYDEFTQTLRNTLSGSRWRITYVGPAASFAPAAPVDLIVAVGGEALRDMLVQERKTPLLATLLTRSAYDRLLGERPSREPTGGRKISAIYLDQPPARLAAFVQHLLPGQQRVGLLLSEQTRRQGNDFRDGLARLKLDVQVEYANHPEVMLPALESLLPRIDVLLAIPDSTLYTRDSIKPLLITTYRHRRPLVAFSQAFVRAGALAALYVTPEQMGRQVGEQILRSGNMLPPPMTASGYTVSVNTNVADALGLRIPDERSLYRALQAEGGSP